MSEDTFDRRPLGPNWTTRTYGVGMAPKQPAPASLSLSLQQPVLGYDWKPAIVAHGRSDDDHPNVGARVHADTVCTRCRKPFAAGHVLTLDLKPNMAGTARHTDCNDPKLEAEETA